MSFLNNMIRHRSARISDRYTEVWQELAKKYNPKKILSYGCGLGEECFSLTKHFPTAQIKGVDIQSKTIERAISKNRFDNVSFEIANYQTLLNDEQYDMIFAMNVFKIIKISEKELNDRYPLHVFDSQIFIFIKFFLVFFIKQNICL
jgi:trans-aconitate methyltransferase